MAKNFEYVISHVGGFSKFQVMMVCAIYGQKFFAGWSMMQMAFGGIIPDFDCVTDYFHGNATNETDSLNKCSVNSTSCTEYRFDASIRSIINEWDLVCGFSWVKATTTSVQMAGVLVGALISGQLGDLYGRKKTCYGFYLALCILNVIIVFSNSWQMFMALRFFIGMGIGSILVTSVPYPIEFVPENWRAAIPVIPMWACSVCSFALLAYLLQNWQHLHLANAAVAAPLLLGWFFVPESIRWLSVQGRTEEAYKVFEKMASINGKSLPEDTMEIIEIVAEKEKVARENGRRYSYRDIFRGPGMAKTTLSLAFIWATMSMVSYGVAFGVSSLGGNFYLNLFLLYALDIPAMFSTFFVSNRFGRKKTCIFFLLLGAASGFTVMAIELTDVVVSPAVVTVLTLISNSSVQATWTTCQSWTIETYPTVTRNLGYGFANTSARVGGIIAPFAINLDDRLALSYSLIGAFLIISTGLAILCRETKGVALADSVTIEVQKPTSNGGGDTNKGDNREKEKF